MIPSVAATAACEGFRPVANAFGDGSGMMYTFGIGSCAWRDSRSTMRVEPDARRPLPARGTS